MLKSRSKGLNTYEIIEAEMVSARKKVKEMDELLQEKEKEALYWRDRYFKGSSNAKIKNYKSRIFDSSKALTDNIDRDDNFNNIDKRIEDNHGNDGDEEDENPNNRAIIEGEG